MSSKNNTQVNSSDPSIAKQIQRQANSLLPRATLSSAPSVNGSGNPATATGSQVARSLAPTVSGSEVLYPQSTSTTSSNAVTINSSVSNDSGDITTVYSSNGQITVTPINQTINQYTSVNSGVSQIVAGNSIIITSSGESGTGIVTINSTVTTGPQGSQGIQGLTGIQGTTGTQGIQGLTGTQGIQGLTGSQGIQGLTGSQGIQGLTGSQGVSSSISNGNSNVNIATANGNVTIAAVGNSVVTITGTGTNITGSISATSVDLSATQASDSIGTRGIPQNSQSANYPLVLADAGRQILHPASDNNPRTFTIPANSSVAFPVGTTITFINLINTVTIAITTDTMTLAGTSSTGSRTLGVNGIATAIKVSSTAWLISGTGLS